MKTKEEKLEELYTKERNLSIKVYAIQMKIKELKKGDKE